MAKAKQLLQDIDTYAQNIGDTIRDSLLVLDRDLRIKSANRAFYKIFQTRAEDTEGRSIDEIGRGEWNVPELLTLLRAIVPTKSHIDDYEMTRDFAHLGERTMLIQARKLYRPGNRTVLIVMTMEDITERRRTESKLVASFEHDRHIAAFLQRFQLYVPPEDAFPGLAVKVIHEPASDEALVGGDFWDTFIATDFKVAFVLGDVMGKGLNAAVFTSEVKYALRAYLREHTEPDIVLWHLNNYLCETNRLYSEAANSLPEGCPITLLLAVIDWNTGDGAVCAAGMEPLLIERNNGEIEEIKNYGLPLGAFAEAKYTSTEFRIDRGDLVVMTTDGITEAHRGPDFLGHHGLIRLVEQASCSNDLEQRGRRILDGARAFAGGKFHDDACILLACRLEVIQ